MIPFITEYRFGDERDVVNRSAIYIQYRGSNLYAVTNKSGEVLNNNNKWEPSPSNRDDDFLKRTRFDLKEALLRGEEIYKK